MKPSFTIRNPKATTVLVWTLRVMLGAVFVFSGFAKTVDPWGTMYKFGEYFSAWGMDIPREISLILGSSLSVFELALGAMLLLGCFRRVAAWLTAGFMAAMTLLTVYIYFKDPVSDCGCFGDALVISNGATLLKNIILCVPAFFILTLNTKASGLVKMKLQWLAAIVVIAYGAGLAFIGHHVQPLIDFRPFPVGYNIAPVQTQPVDMKGMRFVYERDGERREFDADDIPEDDSWTFVERIEPESATLSSDFVINDEEGDDVTSDVIPEHGKTLLMLISDPRVVGLSRSHSADKFAEAMSDSDGNFAVVVAADYPGGSEAWSERVHADNYEVYQAEDTDLKMLARGDIALVYIVDGNIAWKYNAYHFAPDFSDRCVAKPALLDEVRPVYEEYSLLTWTLWTVAVLLLIIAAGPILRLLRPGKTKKPAKETAEVK